MLGRGILTHVKTKGNAEGMARTLESMETVREGLIFANLVDFDQLYGHRNDAEGYGRALEAVDAWVPRLLERMADRDMVIFTADHGCDPTTPSTDHSREYVPVMAYAPAARKDVNLGTRASISDIGQTVAEVFGARLEHGSSFLSAIL